MSISPSPPLAPPFSVTTTGTGASLLFCTAAWIMRAIWSEAPPAPAGTMISIGLVGAQAAAAGKYGEAGEAGREHGGAPPGRIP